MRIFDSFFSNSKLNESETEFASDSSEFEFVSPKSEKIQNRKLTGKKGRKSSAELKRINQNYERNISSQGGWRATEESGSNLKLDMQEKSTKVRFNSGSEINTQMPEVSHDNQTENNFIEKIIPDKKLEESQAIDSENKKEIGDVTSEPNKKDDNVDTDQQEQSDDERSDSPEKNRTSSVSSKIPQYIKPKKCNISMKKPSSFLPRPIKI